MLPFSFEDEMDYYDLLDVKPEATPEQIREGYLRAKAAYGKGSLAIYTLMDPQETQETLAKIEEAYQVLSAPERRKEYDQRHGSISTPAIAGGGAAIDAAQPFEARAPREELRIAKVISIDRNPVIETAPPVSRASVETVEHTTVADSISESVKDPTIDEEIANQSDWSGAFLKRVREARCLSIEEMSNITRVAKSYLMAIEADDYAKLPVAVFTRGFVIQIAKILKLPHEKVSLHFMARFNSARPAAK
jgi:hypothetical protein